MSTHHLAIQLAANAGSAMGPNPVPGALVRNAIVVANAMERMMSYRNVNLELCIGRALAIRDTVLTPRQAEDLVRSCDAVLDDIE